MKTMGIYIEDNQYTVSRYCTDTASTVYEYLDDKDIQHTVEDIIENSLFVSESLADYVIYSNRAMDNDLNVKVVPMEHPIMIATLRERRLEKSEYSIWVMDKPTSYGYNSYQIVEKAIRFAREVTRILDDVCNIILDENWGNDVFKTHYVYVTYNNGTQKRIEYDGYNEEKFLVDFLNLNNIQPLSADKVRTEFLPTTSYMYSYDVCKVM